VRELEEDLDAETRGKAEQQKSIKKNDRKLKELLAQAEEDHRNIEKLQDTNERQNKKLTQLRRRAEEAVCFQLN
jgi:predicted RNase H-like nuclease (RuvC/YqgF family)